MGREDTEDVGICCEGKRWDVLLGIVPDSFGLVS
jgi:hypothetical protein